MPQETLTVTLLGRDYRVACAPDEKEQLLACARYVDQKMSTIHAANKVQGVDRIAALAALQIAQELFAAKSADGVSVGELRRRLKDLNTTVDELLAPQGTLFP